MDNQSIQAVTLDVGGTLLEPWPSVGHVYAEAASKFGISVAPDHLNQRFAQAWKGRRNFDYSRLAWKRVVNETFAGLADTLPAEDCFHAIYGSFGRAGAWRVFDDVWPALRALRQRGLKLAVISNWDERLVPLLKELQLWDQFDSVVVSDEAGHTKPAPEIFRLAASRLGLSPGRILHVGDSATEDVAGARSAGMHSLFLDRRLAEADGERIPTLAWIGPTLENAAAGSSSD